MVIYILLLKLIRNSILIAQLSIKIFYLVVSFNELFTMIRLERKRSYVSRTALRSFLKTRKI